MKEQLALQELLRHRFARAQSVNSRYSLRSFAKKLNIHFAALSAIINGKRFVSKKLATRIADSLELDPQERSELLALFPEQKSKLREIQFKGEAPKPVYALLNPDQLKLASEWEHFAVMSLIKCQDFQSTPIWIAKRLNIPESKASEVIKRLVNAKLLFIDENGDLTRSKENFRTPDNIPSETIKSAHTESLDIAKKSLQSVPVELRDFTSVTTAIYPGKINEAKEMIRKFQDELCDKLEDGVQTEVYRISIQLFPLSHPISGENNVQSI